jgi:hypothetical protein
MVRSPVSSRSSVGQQFGPGDDGSGGVRPHLDAALAALLVVIVPAMLA